MKMCFCRFLLAVAIIVLAVFFWQAGWARVVTIIAGALLAIMSLFYQISALIQEVNKVLRILII